MQYMQLSSDQRARVAVFGLKMRMSGVVARWRKRTRQSRVRYLCLCELVSTEADYNRDLRLILEKMQLPLRECGAISELEEQQLFPNFKGMIDLSSQLLTDVTKLRDEWSPHTTLIGQTMIRYSKFLQIYSEFFRSYQRTLARLIGLLEREEVRTVQAQLAPNTFQNLWSKPFQRPLKYKLLLSSYFKETCKSHADYPHIAKAIHCYEEVSQRNNKALENKEKSQSLLALDARYPGILDNDSKYYISVIEGSLPDQRVKCHVLSNMLLIVSTEEPGEPEVVRVYFDEHSFVAPLKEVLYFKNRLYICGRRKSVQLCFADPQGRNQCEREVQGIINEIYRSQYMRKELTAKVRSSNEFRQSQQQDPNRGSYMQLKQILPKPPRLLVVGQIRRRYGCIKTYKIYFVVRFILPFGEDNSQDLYVELDELLALETCMRALYPQELKGVPMIEQPSKLMSTPEIRINSVKALQYKGIYATMLLNFLFRHPRIAKRTDIIAHRLRVCEPMWLYCQYGALGCVCHFCTNGGVLVTVEQYQREAAQRLQNRQAPNTFLCPFRTIHAQDMVAQTDLSLCPSANDSLLFLRCERGRLDYRLADSTPGSHLRKKVVIHIEQLQGNRLLELLVDPQQRVGQILEICGRYHGLRMEDHQLFLCVNKNTYMLGRDEVFWDILNNQTVAGDNFFSFFKTAFGEKEDLSFRFYIRKVWVLETALEKANYNREGQVSFLLEQFLLRLRRHEVKLTIENSSTLYACYFAMRQFGKEAAVQEEQLKGLLASKRWKAMEWQQRAELLGIVRMKVEALMKKQTQAQVLRKVWNCTVGMGQNCPGWSAFFFAATVQSHPQYPQGFQVRMGADLEKLYVMDAQTMTTVLEFGLIQVQPLLVFSSWELRITTAAFQYIFSGDSLFHLQQLIGTYVLYRQLSQS